MSKKAEEIVKKISPIEKKVIPYLRENFETIQSKSGLDATSVLRALKFLEQKEILKISSKKSKIVDFDTNGIYYKKNHLPERKLLLFLEKNDRIGFEEARKLSKLSDNEFKVSLGVLKDKAIIEIRSGKIFVTASKDELSKKFLEEKFLEALPLEEESLSPEQKNAYLSLKKRKEIIKVEEKTLTEIKLTDIGKILITKDFSENFIEEITPEIIKNWKRGNVLREYDIHSEVPKISGGKRHFVSEAINRGKRVWLDLGFSEMSGGKTSTSFWNFDALFTAQDHPAREMQDTFFIKNIEGKLPEKKVVDDVKKAHERGVAGSSGWQYSWNEREAKKVVLRTHTTCLSVQTLAKLKNVKDKRGKYFSIGKCFRNETLDWSHGFEFNQTEGIVIDPEANFTHLLGYLMEFFNKMGFDEVKFVPSFFAYTEPSVEIYGFHRGRKVWIEIGGAGIFRPEVVVPLLGEYVPVLAWGPGFDRLIMDSYEIKDLREMYENDIKKLRDKKVAT